MFCGWNEQSYVYVPAFAKVKLTVSPGFMMPTTWPLSMSRTEWVKLSEFFQVTVVPAFTTMSAGLNR